jgi:hypothetical protein
MASLQPAPSVRLLRVSFGITAIAILVAFASDMAVQVLTPAKLAFVLGGFALLIPTLVLEDPKAYWLFLLVLSIPFDINKWLSAWLIDPQTLVDAYGQPASGSAVVEVYLTDAVLILLLLPWLARICMRREALYFPKIGYIFVFYLAWALLISLINADSLYLSIFELIRQSLYLLFFVYLINNVVTRRQFRSAILAVFLGLVIGAGTVIAFFEIGIGTETSVFASLHQQPATNGNSEAPSPGQKSQAGVNLTVHATNQRFFGSDSGTKRSQGMFEHPAIAASFCAVLLPIVLAYFVAARTNRDRLLLSLIFACGLAGLLLTFSRAGLIGLMVGTLVFFAIGSWSRLIPRQILIFGGVLLAVAVLFGVPFLLYYFEARPGSFLMRFYLFDAALRGYWHHPILGVGLNNGTAAMKAGRQALLEIGIPMPPTEAADSLYLVLLTEVGPIGFTLFFVFFGKIVMIALRTMRDAATDLKPLLVGMVAGFAALATQNLADDTLGAHAIGAMVWLFAALIIAVARHMQAETQPSRRVTMRRRGGNPLVAPHLNYN